ncbi:MAG: autotransporter domain-containing protein [Planctomycetia bacterium]|nr:autotransporter domain-containing protein [Planctomycetia bacterium]
MTVQNPAGAVIAEGVDFSAVSNFLDGNSVSVNRDFTESAEVDSGNGSPTISIQSNQSGTLRTIRAATGMNGAFFDFQENAMLNFSDVQFSGGTGAINYGIASGGAISVYGGLDFQGSNVVFSNNSAQRNGGAIYVGSGYSTWSGSGVVFSNNSAQRNGGAIYVGMGDMDVIDADFTFVDNTAGGEGGAIWTDGSVKFSGNSRVTFANNRMNDNGTTGTANDIYAGESVSIRDGGEYTFGGGIQARNLNVGSLYQDGSPIVTFGEGSITEVGNKIEIMDAMVKVIGGTDTTLKANSLSVSGNSLLHWEHSIAQAGKVATTTRLPALNAPTIVTLTDENTNAVGYVSEVDGTGITTTVKTDGLSTFNQVRLNRFLASAENLTGTSGLANIQSGDTIIVTGNGNAGGSITGTDSLTLTIQSNNTTMRTITAAENSQVIGDKNIFTGIRELTLYLNKVEFTGADLSGPSSYQTIDGGVLEVSASTSGTFQGTINFYGNAKFTSNRTDGQGGVAYANQDVNITNAEMEFIDNHAGSYGSGGVIASANGNIQISNSNLKFETNTAFNGGALYALKKIEIRNSEVDFIENDADFAGGAIYAYENIAITNSNLRFLNNTAEEYGGAIFTYGDILLNGASNALEFRGNRAWGSHNDLFAGGTTMIQDGGKYYFGGGIETLSLQIGGSAQNGNPTVTLGDKSHSFVGYDSAGSMEIQNAKLVFELGANADNRDEENPYLAASDAEIVRIGENVETDFAIADDFQTPGKGETKNIHLVQADANELSNLGEETLKSTNLWLWQTVLRENDSQYWLSVTRYDPAAEYGNGAGTETLYGEVFFDNNHSPETIRQEINGATGELFASAATAQVERLNYLNRIFSNRLAFQEEPCCYTREAGCGGEAICCRESGRNFWFSGYGMGGNVQTHHQFTGYDYHAGGMLIGADWEEMYHRFGFFYGYGQSDLSALASSLEYDDHTFGAYLRWENQVGYTTALAAFSFSSADATRYYRGAYDGEFDSWQADLYVEKGVRSEKFWGMQWNPFVALQYIRYAGDAFQIGDLGMEDVEYNSLRTILGLRFGQSFYTRLGMANFSMSLAWNHELLDADASFTAYRNQSLATVFGNGGGRDWFEYTLGLGVDLSRRVTLSGDYYLMINEHSAMNAGMATLSIQF